MRTDPRTIQVAEFVPHAPDQVWKALTEPDLMARWLMPNDFELRIGHTFTFEVPVVRTVEVRDMGYSEVLDYETDRMLQIAWRAAPDDVDTLDSTVTFTLEPAATGTMLLVRHDGFDPDNFYQVLARRLLASAWSGVGDRIAKVLAAAHN